MNDSLLNNDDTKILPNTANKISGAANASGNSENANAENTTEDIINYYADSTYTDEPDNTVVSAASAASAAFAETSGGRDVSEIPPETVVITQKKDFSIDINPKKNDNPFFAYIMTGIAALLFIGLGFFIGRFILPVSDSEIDAKKVELAKDDSAYQSANTENLALKASITSLEAENENIVTVFDEVLEYQETLETAQSTHDEQQAALDSVNSQLSELKENYDELNSQMQEIKAETVILSPGTYTVGEHIAAGNYSVTGSGSILIASSDNNLKVNETLFTDEPQAYTLSDNDIIRLETSAEFIPMED